MLIYVIVGFCLMLWFINTEYNDCEGDYNIGKEELFVSALILFLGPTLVLAGIGFLIILGICAVAADMINRLPDVVVTLKKPTKEDDS